MDELLGIGIVHAGYDQGTSQKVSEWIRRMNLRPMPNVNLALASY